MRHVITAATLTAFMGLGLACMPTPGSAQDYDDAELANRLREAIDAQQSANDPLGIEESLGLQAQDLLSERELDDLVAPVALYPDALLAQVLVAATYPFQIAKADQLIDASSELSDEELSDALAAQEWDPSILVLLSGFPTVIGRMAEDLAWTERLGLAMVQQDEDVLAAVQRMRARAESTGYLTSNQAQVIEREEDQIYIRPADPNLIYVPSYDTAAAFTSPATAEPYYAPQPQAGFSAQDALIGGAIGFGSALLVNELFGDKDEDKDNEGWDDYWNRPGSIDWRERELYPRAYRREIRADAREAAAWSAERDRYWDRNARRWRREDAEARREYQQERRDALERLERRERQASRGLRDWREGLREEERRRERRQDRAQDRREDAREAARREAERDAARRQAERERDEKRQRERAGQSEREERARQAERRQEQAREAAREEERRRERKREREQERAREAARERERSPEKERAREAAREQERSREQGRARQQERPREAGQDQERARGQERAREAEREQQRSRSPERRSDEQRRERAQEAPREKKGERKRECRDGDENCRQRQRN